MIDAPFVRSPYNYDMNAAGDAGGLLCLDKTRTQQHMADECDINKLVERFVVTGEIPQLTMPPMQGDFTNVPTYQGALNLITEARNSFMQLDAKIRARFENDPGQFVAFASDEANRDQLRQWGLLSPQAVQAFELQQQTQRDLDASNAAAAAEYKALKGRKKGAGGDPDQFTT